MENTKTKFDDLIKLIKNNQDRFADNPQNITNASNNQSFLIPEASQKLDNLNNEVNLISNDLNLLSKALANTIDNERLYHNNNQQILDHICSQQMETREKINIKNF